MGNKRSAGSFCSLVVATTTGAFDSVTSLPVAALGNGAECYCVANQGTYRYDSTSTQTTVGDLFLVPLSGGGCWVKQNAEVSYRSAFALSPSQFGIPRTSTNVWQALPGVNPGTYQIVHLGTFFTLNTSTGVVTYSGPSGLEFMVMMTMSWFSPSTANEIFRADLSINGALIGTTTQGPEIVSTGANVDEFLQLTQIYMTPFNNGQTFQSVIWVSGAAAIYQLQSYQLKVIKL